MLKRRNEDLQKMLELASTRVQPGTPTSNTPRLRIDLRESQILDNPASYASMEDNDLAGIRWLICAGVPRSRIASALGFWV